MNLLEIPEGTVLRQTRFSSARIPIRDLDLEGNPYQGTAGLAGGWFEDPQDELDAMREVHWTISGCCCVAPW